MVERLISEYMPYICIVYVKYIQIPQCSLFYIEYNGDTLEGSISNLRGNKDKEDIDNEDKNNI